MCELLVGIYKCFEFCAVGCLCTGKYTYWLLIISLRDLINLVTAGDMPITLYKYVHSKWITFMHTFVPTRKKLFMSVCWWCNYTYCLRHWHWCLKWIYNLIPMTVWKSCILFLSFYDQDNLIHCLYTCWVQSCLNGIQYHN